LAITYAIPLETEIDINGQISDYYGLAYEVENNNEIIKYGGAKYCIERQDIASHVNNYTQDQNYYMYNTAYSVQPDVITASSEDDNTADNNYDMRVHFSNPKTNGE